MQGPFDIAVAVIRRGDAVLLQQRSTEPFAGRWELPGGKVLPGEAPARAALREVAEELGVAARNPRLLLVHEHRYPQGPWVKLHAFEVELDAPPPATRMCRWVRLAEVARLPVLEGTRPILAALAPAKP